jgi:hypothetical protein
MHLIRQKEDKNHDTLIALQKMLMITSLFYLAKIIQIINTDLNTLAG